MRISTRNLLVVSGIFVLGAMASCNSTVNDNNYLVLGNVINHFELSGIKIEQVQPLVPELVNATTGAAIMIDKQEVGIYKYDTQNQKNRDTLKRLRENEYIYIMAMKYPVVVNGSFVFLGVHNHPQKHKIMEAIKTLK